jgi:hypothetical protein
VMFLFRDEGYPVVLTALLRALRAYACSAFERHPMRLRGVPAKIGGAHLLVAKQLLRCAFDR